MNTRSDDVAASAGLCAHLVGLLAGAGLILGLTLLMVLLIKHWPLP